MHSFHTVQLALARYEHTLLEEQTPCPNNLPNSGTGELSILADKHRGSCRALKRSCPCHMHTLVTAMQIFRHSRRIWNKGGAPTCDHSRVLRPQSGLTHSSFLLPLSRPTSRKVLIFFSMKSTLHKAQALRQDSRKPLSIAPAGQRPTTCSKCSKPEMNAVVVSSYRREPAGQLRALRGIQL